MSESQIEQPNPQQIAAELVSGLANAKRLVDQTKLLLQAGSEDTGFASLVTPHAFQVENPAPPS